MLPQMLLHIFGAWRWLLVIFGARRCLLLTILTGLKLQLLPSHAIFAKRRSSAAPVIDRLNRFEFVIAAFSRDLCETAHFALLMFMLDVICCTYCWSAYVVLKFHCNLHACLPIRRWA